MIEFNKFIPSLKQFNNWSLPSKASFIGIPLAVLLFLLTFIFGPSKCTQDEINNKQDTLISAINEIKRPPSPDTISIFPPDIIHFTSKKIDFNSKIDTLSIVTKDDDFIFRISEIKQLNDKFIITLTADIIDNVNHSKWLNQVTYVELTKGKTAEINTNKFSVFININKTSIGNAIIHLGVKPFYTPFVFKNFVVSGNCFYFRQIASRNSLFWSNDRIGTATGVRKDGTEGKVLILTGTFTNTLSTDLKFDLIQLKYLLAGEKNGLKNQKTPLFTGVNTFDTLLDLNSGEIIILKNHDLKGKMCFDFPPDLEKDWELTEQAKFVLAVKDINNMWHLSEFNINKSFH